VDYITKKTQELTERVEDLKNASYNLALVEIEEIIRANNDATEPIEEYSLGTLASGSRRWLEGYHQCGTFLLAKIRSMYKYV
jgi:hypothetical protein